MVWIFIFDNEAIKSFESMKAINALKLAHQTCMHRYFRSHPQDSDLPNQGREAVSSKVPQVIWYTASTENHAPKTFEL